MQVHSKSVEKQSYNFMAHSYAFRDKLAIPTSNGMHIITISEIQYLESKSNYTEIHLMNGSNIIVSKTLKSVLIKLPKSIFIRIHQSFVVNVNEIVFIESTKLRLKDQAEFPISRAFKKSLSRLLGEIIV